MATYIILSKLRPGAFDDPADFKKAAAVVSEKIKTQCPGVEWKSSYVVMGRFDVVDILESDNPGAVEKAALIINSYGHANTETMPATPWKEFMGNL